MAIQVFDTFVWQMCKSLHLFSLLPYFFCALSLSFSIGLSGCYSGFVAYRALATRAVSATCVCQPPSLGILPSYFTAGGSDRVCGITANEDVHILWRSIGRRPDVYLLLSFGLFVVNNTVLGLSRLTVPHRAISKALVWYCSN